MSRANPLPEPPGPMAGPPTLRRSLSLPMLALYGLGTTIGAGIFVLVGKVAGLAGLQAPLAFLLAAVMAAPTALSFGELAARFPVSAGEAAYVTHGFRLRFLPLAVGLTVASAGLVSTAAIAIGFAGYLGLFLDLPAPVMTAALLLLLGVLAIWGIVESVTVAALLTVAEIGALVLVIATGIDDVVLQPARVADALLPAPGDLLAMAPAILAGGVLAFYAFIGFEDMVNVAEEVRDVERTLPRAILVTLGATTLLYVLVALVAVLIAAPAELAASDAPLALVYERASGWNPAPISLVAIFAVANGALIQIIMAARLATHPHAGGGDAAGDRDRDGSGAGAADRAPRRDHVLPHADRLRAGQWRAARAQAPGGARSGRGAGPALARALAGAGGRARPQSRIHALPGRTVGRPRRLLTGAHAAARRTAGRSSSQRRSPA